MCPQSPGAQRAGRPQPGHISISGETSPVIGQHPVATYLEQLGHVHRLSPSRPSCLRAWALTLGNLCPPQTQPMGTPHASVAPTTKIPTLGALEGRGHLSQRHCDLALVPTLPALGVHASLGSGQVILRCGCRAGGHVGRRAAGLDCRMTSYLGPGELSQGASLRRAQEGCRLTPQRVPGC